MQKILSIRLILLLIIICSCTKEKQENSTYMINESKILPDQEISNFQVEFIDSNQVKARLTAEKAYVFEERKETILDSNVRIVFLSGSNSTRGTVLTSDSARIDDKTKNLYAYSNVNIWSDSTKTSLDTEILEWNEKDQKLYSTEYVVIDSPEERIEGYGFESDQFLHNYKIFKVSGVRQNEK